MSDSEHPLEPRLLPSLLDHRAAAQPNLVWAKYPVSITSYEAGFRAATYSQMRNAVDRTAWFLAEQIGTSTTFETLAYLAPGDLRYHIILLAAVKAGYKPFFPSPRNSIAAQKDLLARLEAHILVTTDPEPPFVSSILQEYPVPVIRIPSLEELLSSEDVPLYPYEKTFEDARREPAYVLHTSGSTGIPKPLIYTHEFAWRIYKSTTLPPPDGLTRIDKYFLQGEWFSFLPAFHIAGIGFGLVLAVYSKSVPVWPLAGRPPSTDAFLEAIKHGSFDWAFLLPVILDDLSNDPASLDLVAKKLQYVFFTGSALPEAVGRAVSSKISVFSGFGSSECAAIPQLRIPDASFTETWRYLYLNPIARPDFRQRMDDLHELVFRRSTDCPDSQPVFAMFPDLDEYETRDLFSSHPSIPNLWRHRGRRDDIVVFLNGEKTNPVSFEHHISEHPAVRSALVAGNQRFEACLLVEPTTAALSDVEKAELIDTMWPTVEEANALCPAHARVSKSKILVLDAARPMLRAGKGTVQRAGTLQLYQKEIDALYGDGGTDSPEIHKLLVPLPSLQHATAALHDLVTGITSWPQFEDSADFFALGMDSLHVLHLSAAIRSSLGVPFPPITVYRNPSVELLAKQVYASAVGAVEPESDRIATMAQLLHSYEQKIDELASSSPSTNTPERATPTSLPQVTILTGSTGNVGSFLLNHLLSNPAVSHIYCLNRSKDSKAAQIASNQRRKIPHDFPERKVTFLTADLTAPNLGLDAATYSILITRTTRIIHSAWPVNFNQPLQYFWPSLKGLLSLITLARECIIAPSLIFLSSVSAVSSYTGKNASGTSTPPSPSTPIPIPEKIIPLPSISSATGYGESKYLAERILAYAAPKLRINCGIARIGQVCGTSGASDGDPRAWNRAEWLPSLVVSSRTLGMLPTSLGAGGMFDQVDWVPVDLLAGVLGELSGAVPGFGENTGDVDGAGEDGIKVFHCVNPARIPWMALVPVVLEELARAGARPRQTTKTLEIADQEPEPELKLATVSLAEWVKKLQESLRSAGEGGGHVDVNTNPAAKLASFYEGLLDDKNYGGARLSTMKTEQVSKRLSELQAVRPEWMAGWVREWLD